MQISSSFGIIYLQLNTEIHKDTLFEILTWILFVQAKTSILRTGRLINAAYKRLFVTESIKPTKSYLYDMCNKSSIIVGYRCIISAYCPSDNLGVNLFFPILGNGRLKYNYLNIDVNLRIGQPTMAKPLLCETPYVAIRDFAERSTVRLFGKWEALHLIEIDWDDFVYESGMFGLDLSEMTHF